MTAAIVNSMSIPGESAASAEASIARVAGQAEQVMVTHDGRRVCWRRFGEGRPLVLIHGGHGSWLHWLRNVETLAGRFAVWVPDLPGYGDSDLAGQPGLSGVLDATRATLDVVVGEESVIDLVGFSFGGLMAAHVAALRGRVGRLALIGPAGHGGTRRPRGVLRSWRREAQEDDCGAVAAIMRHNLTVQMLHHEARVDAVALKIHTDSCLRARFRSKEFSRRGGLGVLLDHHRGALLLTWGEHDVTAEPETLAQVLSAGRRNCRTHIVPDAGHWAQYEQACHINRLLLDWLGDENAGDMK